MPKIKRFAKVKILPAEGIVQNLVHDDEGYRITVSIPGRKGKWWIVVPDFMVEEIK